MQYRILGKTGLRVSVLSYGASSLGNVFEQIDERKATQTLHMALELGLNFIDVAPLYGLTLAETVLGRALKGMDRDRYLVATKVGRQTVTDFDFSADGVIANVDASLERLQLDHIDLIQCHDIEFVDLAQVVNEAIPALRRLQEQGKVRFVGITGLPFKSFRYVLDRAGVDTVLSYCRYALNNTMLEDLLPYLQSKGVGVINASPLSMRLLTDRGAPDWHPASQRIRDACALAAEHCRRRGTNISHLAMQFALANPHIHTTVAGTVNQEHMERNIALIDSRPDPELLAEVQNILAPVRDQTWAAGRPENNDS